MTGSYHYLSTKIPIPFEGRRKDGVVTLTTKGKDAPGERFTGQLIFSNKQLISFAGHWQKRTLSNTTAKPEFVVFSHSINLPAITCEHMELTPGVAFSYTDLGSGIGSPVVIDYECPKSMRHFEPLKKLLEMAETIRRDWNCGGSSRHVYQRHFLYDLAILGYAPERYKERQPNRSFEYFEEWSYASPYNRKVYEAYMDELFTVKPQLLKWYSANYQIDNQTAEKYTQYVIHLIAERGFGSYTHNWVPALVANMDLAMKGDDTLFLQSINDSTEIAKLNSLMRALLNERGQHLIAPLVNSLKDKRFPRRGETPVSAAIFNIDNLSFLLDAGFDPNHQNIFGKTPIYYAIQFNLHRSVELLLEAGADVNHRYQFEDEEDRRCLAITHWLRTPFMHAAQHADNRMLKLLLDAGALPITRDILGDNALNYAEKNEIFDTIDFVKEALTRYTPEQVISGDLLSFQELQALETEMLDDVKSAFSQGQQTEAIKLLNKVDRRFPNSINVLLTKQALSLSIGELDKSLEHTRKLFRSTKITRAQTLEAYKNLNSICESLVKSTDHQRGSYDISHGRCSKWPLGLLFESGKYRENEDIDTQLRNVFFSSTDDIRRCLFAQGNTRAIVYDGQDFYALLAEKENLFGKQLTLTKKYAVGGTRFEPGTSTSNLSTKIDNASDVRFGEHPIQRIRFKADFDLQNLIRIEMDGNSCSFFEGAVPD